MLDQRERRLRLALVLNAAIVAAQVAGGFIAGSVALLADAGHNLADVAGVLLALAAARLSRRSPTERVTYGYHRATILAALANAVLLAGVTLVIAVEAVRRLAHPSPVRGGIVVAVALVAAAVNAGAAWGLREHLGDLNTKAAVLHLLGDALGSGGVAVAGVVILVTGGFYGIDPVVSLVVCVLIAMQAWQLMRDSVAVLLESVPAHLDVEAVTATMAAEPGVAHVHDLHVWSLSSEIAALSAHVLLTGHPTLEEAQALGDRVKARLHAGFGIAHATLELECEPCLPEDPCALEGSSLEESGR